MERNLYEDKARCSGCGTCAAACPASAISMETDEYGFRFPKIDSILCVNCNKCVRVCGFQNDKVINNILAVYAVIGKNIDILESTSGGAFASFAKAILNEDGHVFGMSYKKSEYGLEVVSCEVQREQELQTILGSKYVQAYAEMVFSRIKELLNAEASVLFSGTPCQVDGLNHYLGKNYDNLLTIDLICHGAPNPQFFNDYCKLIKKYTKIDVENVVFRDKKRGWNIIGSIQGLKRGKHIELPLKVSMSSYYNMFLSGSIYRESCYKCPYACEHRPGDISIGDYWGVENEQPELLIKNGGLFDEKKGISCLMINTQKGKKYFEKYRDNLIYADSTFAQISRKNGQLLHPSHRHENYDAIMSVYKNGGYESVEKWFIKQQGIKYFLRLIKYMFEN